MRLLCLGLGVPTHWLRTSQYSKQLVRPEEKVAASNTQQTPRMQLD